jgi:hypothetical protein
MKQTCIGQIDFYGTERESKTTEVYMTTKTVYASAEFLPNKFLQQKKQQRSKVPVRSKTSVVCGSGGFAFGVFLGLIGSINTWGNVIIGRSYVSL